MDNSHNYNYQKKGEDDQEEDGDSDTSVLDGDDGAGPDTSKESDAATRHL